jgi:GNAT superfamily N-acetyltransferase
MDVRPARVSEIDALATLWHAGWTDAHAAIVPAELKQVRTLDSFRDRLQAGLANVTTVGEIGMPLGLCWVKDDELYQLYVAANARGTGVASALIADAESRLLNAGFNVGWLACAIGNPRAARFYEKSGWHRARNMINVLDTTAGTFQLEVWRYEKSLRSGAGVPRC